MNLVFFLSVILKGIGAVFEILLQILITKELGVSGYGDYSTWINAADLLFWVFFSGLVKCNTFYLSGRYSSISVFKRRYYGFYVLPVLAAAAGGVLLFGGSPMLCFIVAITGLELVFYDRSSTLIAWGQPRRSLIGEYVLGRMTLLAGVFLLGRWDRMDLQSLLWLYLLQFVLVILFFSIRRKRQTAYTDVSGEVSLKKWGAYQWADLMHSMIAQMPVVLQYFFAGAFEAGVVSIVLLVKKLINFVSGPTAKIFLPEFSRLYRTGDRNRIRDFYASIMRVQMLFVGPLAVVLLAFPGIVLRILAEELTQHAGLFMLCSFVFLLTATLGPCGGILQMTGNEKMDNRCREGSLLVMVLTMVLFGRDRLFVLYGLCAQAAFEAVCKYTFVCKWMKKAPVGFASYLKWWLLPGMVIGAVYILGLRDSVVWMLAAAGGVFVVECVMELRRNDGLAAVLKSRKGKV